MNAKRIEEAAEEIRNIQHRIEFLDAIIQGGTSQNVGVSWYNKDRHQAGESLGQCMRPETVASIFTAIQVMARVEKEHLEAQIKKIESE